MIRPTRSKSARRYASATISMPLTKPSSRHGSVRNSRAPALNETSLPSGRHAASTAGSSMTTRTPRRTAAWARQAANASTPAACEARAARSVLGSVVASESTRNAPTRFLRSGGARTIRVSQPTPTPKAQRLRSGESPIAQVRRAGRWSSARPPTTTVPEPAKCCLRHQRSFPLCVRAPDRTAT